MQKIYFPIPVEVHCEDQTYTAICDDLGLGAQGQSEDSALNKLCESIRSFVEAQTGSGQLHQMLMACGLMYSGIGDMPVVKRRNAEILVKVPVPVSQLSAF